MRIVLCKELENPFLLNLMLNILVWDQPNSMISILYLNWTSPYITSIKLNRIQTIKSKSSVSYISYSCLYVCVFTSIYVECIHIPTVKALITRQKFLINKKTFKTSIHNIDGWQIDVYIKLRSFKENVRYVSTWSWYESFYCKSLKA